MRGERVLRLRIMYRYVGSSPHARGTLHQVVAHLVMLRFIPACAGNAPPPRPARPSTTVHPRMRGERMVSPNIVVSPTGSSPHARGTRPALSGSILCCRFIPACAGNASRQAGARARQPVHPRMRGERRLAARNGAKTTGSSPHARGTPMGSPTGTITGRFIPACAGNALPISY